MSDYSAKANEKDNFEKQLFSITTIIQTELIKEGVRYSSQASGFFYSKTSPTDPNNNGPQWHKLESYWLITNRHVALQKIEDKMKEILKQNLTFEKVFVEDVDAKVAEFKAQGEIYKAELLEEHKNDNPWSNNGAIRIFRFRPSRSTSIFAPCLSLFNIK